MGFNEPRRQVADVLLTAPEPQFRASQEGSPRAYRPSAMSATTFTEANVGAASVGQYVIPEDGNCRGQIRMVTSFSGTVATVDRAWNSVTGCTSLRAFRPADVPWRATTAGNTQHIPCSDHANITNEPDNYWGTVAASKGYYWYGVGGINAGSATQIAGFTSTTGVLTFATALSSVALSNLGLIGKVLRPEGPITASLERNFLHRRIVGYGDADQAAPLTYKPTSISFELAQRPVTSSAVDAIAALAPVEIGDMLGDVMAETKDTGDTVSSASGTTLTVTAGSRFSVGGFVALQTGEVAQIQSKATNALTVGTGHMTAASVQNASVVLASCWYQRKASDFRTRTLRYYRGRNTLQFFHGCMPKVTLKVSRDDIARFAFEYMAPEAGEYDVACPVAAGATNPLGILDTTVPVDSKASRCLFNGTKWLIDSFELDLGFEPKLRGSLPGMNQADGMWMDLGPAKGKMTLYAEENDNSGVERIQDLASRGVAVDFLWHKGTAGKEIFAVGIPALQIAPSRFEYQDGTGKFSCEFDVVLPQATRGSTAAAAMPPFAIGWL
jgi:hypothetical protein